MVGFSELKWLMCLLLLECGLVVVVKVLFMMSVNLVVVKMSVRCCSLSGMIGGDFLLCNLNVLIVIMIVLVSKVIDRSRCVMIMG